MINHSESGTRREVASIDDTATALDVSPRTVKRMINRRELRAVIVGRCLKIPRTEIERILQSDARAEASR